MLALRLLQENTTSTNISWLIWVVLALFVLMVFLGWWASGRLPKDEDTIVVHEGGSDATSEHGGPEHEDAASEHE